MSATGKHTKSQQRRRPSSVVQVVALAIGICAIASVRGSLAAVHERQTVLEGESLLLDPKYSVVASLGHRSAFADYIYGHALVAYGRSFQEKRLYRGAYRALDTVTTLDPKFVQPYLYADALLTMQSQPVPEENFRLVRKLHDRGTKALPFDAELWSVAGQFAAYLAPRHLPKEERNAVRIAGARLMARACELASDNENIPYHCIAAAKILNHRGMREAMIRMLTRTLAVNDDPTIRARVRDLLERVVGEREDERQAQRIAEVEKIWQQSLPHVPRNMVSLLAPPVPALRCVSLEHPPECEASWREKGRRLGQGQ